MRAAIVCAMENGVLWRTVWWISR